MRIRSEITVSFTWHDMTWLNSSLDWCCFLSVQTTAYTRTSDFIANHLHSPHKPNLPPKTCFDNFIMDAIKSTIDGDFQRINVQNDFRIAIYCACKLKIPKYLRLWLILTMYPVEINDPLDTLSYCFSMTTCSQCLGFVLLYVRRENFNFRLRKPKMSLFHHH